ncbi:MAG: hypothetical protein ACRCXN_12895 [Bacteroidales bacterium]
MAIVELRPSRVCSVGGVYPDFVGYSITSSNSFEEVDLFDGDGGVIVEKLFIIIVSGVGKISLASILAGKLSAKRVELGAYFVSSDMSVEFYITGDGFDESLQKRIAVLAMQYTENSDFLAYVATETNVAKIPSPFKTVPLFKRAWLSFFNDYAPDAVYLEEKFYNTDGSLLLTDMKFLDNVGLGFARILIIATALFGCVKKECTVFIAPSQLVKNYHFETGLADWTPSNPVGVVLPTPYNTTFVRFLGGGTDRVMKLEQSINVVTSGDYIITVGYNGVDLPSNAVQVDIGLGAEFLFFAENGVNKRQTFVVNGLPSGIYDFYISVFLPGSGDLNAFDLDFISITAAPIARTETKQFDYQTDICAPYEITWQTLLGDWATYNFEVMSMGTESIETFEHMTYGERFERVSQSKTRQTMSLSSFSVPSEHLPALTSILSSPEVYWRNESGQLVYIKVATKQLPLVDTQKYIHSIKLDFDLPYNS